MRVGSVFQPTGFCLVSQIHRESVLLSSLRWWWMNLVVLFNKMVARRRGRQLSPFFPAFPWNFGKPWRGMKSLGATLLPFASDFRRDGRNPDCCQPRRRGAIRRGVVD